MVLKKLAHYLNPANLFKKGDKNINLRFMHGINRISIFVFLICLVVLAIKWFSH